MVPDATPIEAGRARPDTSARKGPDRSETDTLKATMRAAVARLGLPRHEKHVLEALIDIWQPAGGLWPEQATIAAVAVYGDRRTRQALMTLRERGFLTWERRRYRGVQTSNLYQFTPKFWAIVREGRGGATEGNKCRPQSAKNAARRRQSVPTNGDLPVSESISLNGGVRPTTPSTPLATSAAASSQAIPLPSLESVSQHGGSEGIRFDLARIFFEERAKRYSDTDHGTMRVDNLRDAEAKIAALVAEACRWANEHRVAHDPTVVCDEIARDLVRLWLAHPGTARPDAPRGALIERGHPFGLLHGDVRRFGGKALDAWKKAHTPKRAPLPPLREPPPRRFVGAGAGLTFQVPASVHAQASAPVLPKSQTSSAPVSVAASSVAAPSIASPTADEDPAGHQHRKNKERGADVRAWRQIRTRAAVDVGRTLPVTPITDLPASTYAPPKPYDPERPRFGLSPERLDAWRALVREEQSAAELVAWNAYDAEQAKGAACDTAAVPRWEELLHVARRGGDPVEHVRANAEELHDAPPLATEPADPDTAERDDEAGDGADLDTTEQHAQAADGLPPPPERERHERAAKLRAFLGSGVPVDEPRPLGVTLGRLQAFVQAQQEQRSITHVAELPRAPAPGDRFVERDDEADDEQLEHQERDVLRASSDVADLERVREVHEAEPALAQLAPARGEELVPTTEAAVTDETGRTRKRTIHGGRARQGTSARERSALVAALADRSTGDEASDDEGDCGTEAGHSPPLLRDVRERPGDHSAQRRRRPPPERS